MAPLIETLGQMLTLKTIIVEYDAALKKFNVEPK
jgi:hypothetical protein